jgi:predicted trehalose synthase
MTVRFKTTETEVTIKTEWNTLHQFFDQEGKIRHCAAPWLSASTTCISARAAYGTLRRVLSGFWPCCEMTAVLAS